MAHLNQQAHVSVREIHQRVDSDKGLKTMAKIAPIADEFAEDLLSVLEPSERDVFQLIEEKLFKSNLG